MCEQITSRVLEGGRVGVREFSTTDIELLVRAKKQAIPRGEFYIFICPKKGLIIDKDIDLIRNEELSTSIISHSNSILYVEYYN